MFRIYAGHSTAAASNAPYRGNLAKGQTGLSVAFALPTQTRDDSDDILARGEVGEVGVPVCHLDDMRALFADIPLWQMNTSMTIDATAPWLLALHVAVAQDQGAVIAELQGTVQNDIIKEYPSCGTCICPPRPFLRMITDMAAWTREHLSKWNPIVYRILIEMLAVTLSKNARARAVQLPAWNEAQGLARPWDRQWSLRMQQIPARKTDLPDYGDLFDGSPVIAARGAAPKAGASDEPAQIDATGVAVEAIGDTRARLVETNAARIAGIEKGETVVAGVNRWQAGEASPLTAGDGAIMATDPAAGADQIGRLMAWRAGGDDRAVRAA